MRLFFLVILTALLSTQIQAQPDPEPETDVRKIKIKLDKRDNCPVRVRETELEDDDDDPDKDRPRCRTKNNAKRASVDAICGFKPGDTIVWRLRGRRNEKTFLIDDLPAGWPVTYSRTRNGKWKAKLVVPNIIEENDNKYTITVPHPNPDDDPNNPRPYPADMDTCELDPRIIIGDLNLR